MTSKSWRGEPNDRCRAVAGGGGTHSVRVVFSADVSARAVAFALGLACLPILIIEPRLDTMTLMQETFNAYNSFILLAVPFFLLTANLMNVRRHHRPADAAFPHHGRACSRQSGANQRRALDLLRRYLRLLDSRCRQPIQDLHRGANQRGLRRHYGGLGRTRGDHSTIDPDDRVGRPAHRFDRGAVSCRHRAWPSDQAGADGNRTRLCQGARLPDLSAFVVARASLRLLDRHSGPDDPGDHCRWQDLRLVHGHRIGVHRRALAAVLSLLVYRDMDLAGLHSALLDTGKLAGIALFCVGTASAFAWLLA